MTSDEHAIADFCGASTSIITLQNSLSQWE
jgi:hypothetical protein